MIFSTHCGTSKTMSWRNRYELAKSTPTEGAPVEHPQPVRRPLAERLAKQLPAEAGPDIVDQHGWQTHWFDAPPNLPASNSVHYDSDETVTKAVDTIAALKDIQKEQSES